MSITPSPTRPPRRRRQSIDRLTLGLLIAFGVVAIITAIIAFSLVRNLVSSWEMTKLPGAPQASANMTTEELLELADTGELPMDQPLQSAEGPEAEPWDGSSRVTVLVMGLDYRDWEAGEIPRTDTMMLATIDPITKTAGLLSIPRDMWVTIPGFDHAKINTAYYLGEVYNLPGGGPALAVQTVEEFMGVQIDYYAQVDFAAFVKFIDEIGGLDLKVEEERITVDPIGQGNTVILYQGVQNLDGATTLAYARARYTEGGDFDRADRQQRVVLTVLEQITTFNMLPTLVTKAPKLYNELSSGIRTNMNITEAIQLARLAISIDRKAIKHEIITPDVVTQDVSPDGLSILVPIPDEIRMIRDKVFSSGGSASPITTIQHTEVQDPAQLAQAEQARISIQNGTQNPGLAQTTGDFFRSQGLNIVEETNADQIYNTSTIIIYNGKPYTIKYLSELMDIPVSHIYNRFDPNAYADVVVILGTKWAESNPIAQ